MSEDAPPISQTGEPEQPAVPPQPAAEQTPEDWEPDANRAHYMADKDKDLQMAASMAEQLGRPEKAEELRQSADVEAQKGAEEYDQEKVRQASAREIELRHQENERRALEEARQRREELVNQMLDQILEGVNLPAGQSADLLDDNYWPEGYGSEPAIAELYKRMSLERPAKDAAPTYSWDISQGGNSHFLDGKNVHAIRRYEAPTNLGTTLVEVRYKTPPYGHDERVKLLVRKDLQEQTAA